MRMEKKFKAGLFVGRFQPFHNGHLAAFRYARPMCRKLIIGIGSSRESGTSRNPISARNRIRIIRSALKAAPGGLKGVSFMEIPDFNDNEKWFDYIISREPGIDVVFSRHWLVKKIFKEKGIAVVSPPWHKRNSISGSRIRWSIRNRGQWESRVPRAAVKEIKRHPIL